MFFGGGVLRVEDTVTNLLFFESLELALTSSGEAPVDDDRLAEGAEPDHGEGIAAPEATASDC